MVEDKEGFRYPHVNTDVCVDCHLCEKVCPILNTKVQESVSQQAFLLQHKDPQILAESTSGGAFTAIANWVIQRGGAVFGAAFDKDFVVKHQYVETFDDLKLFRNSKYVQSEIGSSFNQVLELLKADRWVCFSGTPCQVEGLLNFLRKPYDKLLTIDIMCHSVTSPLAFNRYKDQKIKDFGVVPDRILFRDKSPFGYKYSQMSFYSKGKQIYREGVETDEYLRSFFSDCNVRPSCYECKFKKQHHLSDITIWDCFDVAKFSKELDNDKGVTRLLINSSKGKHVLESLYHDAKIIEIPLNDAVEGVREMLHSVDRPDNRELFFDGIAKGENFSTLFPKTYRNRIQKIVRVNLVRIGLYSPIKRFAKKFIKKIKR